MKVSLNWLAHYVDLTNLSPEALRDALTQSGLEVEGAIERTGPRFTQVVLGQISAINPHPNADKLRLVTVNLGEGRSQQVVCGAPNVAEGLLIAFAQEGAQVLNRKDGSLFTLGQATIRGVPSSGMICSLEELGLEALYPQPSEPGIWPLNNYANESQLGQALPTVLGLEQDACLDTAPTANRGDQMSYLGVAREVAALFERSVKEPELPASLQGELPSQNQVSVQLQGLEQAEPVCSQYYAAELSDVQLGPSPTWLSQALQTSGVRSISNVVDVTNYVMLEQGLPLHAFDADRLLAKANGAPATLSVRPAKPGETLETLDEQQRTLTDASLCITLNDEVVVLAGVMGGAETEIHDGTQRIVLEAACFNAAAIRKSGRSVGLRSEASGRFERGVDAARVKQALLRAVQLLQDLAGAKLVGISSDGKALPSLEPLTLRLSRLEQLIGQAYSAERVTQLLQALGFEVSAGSVPETLQVTVPSWRAADVSKEIDLIEEVVRLDGYDQVPTTLPGQVNVPKASARQRALQTVHRCLQGLNCQEVMTNSLQGPQWLAKVQCPANPHTLVQLNNSHSSEHTQMRQSLLPSLLEVAAYNQSQGSAPTGQWLYELGRVYQQRAKASDKFSGVQETLRLGLLLTGCPKESLWLKEPELDFYTLKGLLETVVEALGLPLAELSLVKAEADAPISKDLKAWQPLYEALHPGQAAFIQLGSGKKAKVLGVLGQLHPQTRQTLKLKQAVFSLELDLDALLKQALGQANTAFVEQAVQQLSPYPSAARDMAISLPVAHTHADVLQVLAPWQESANLQQVDLFDEYVDDALKAAGQRSLAYRLTFQSIERTLNDSEVDSSVRAIREQLQQQLGVQHR